MKQKKVELISFEVKGFRILRAVKIDFEKWKNTGVIEVIGDLGNGKSSVLEALAAATAGTNAVKDKSLLDMGFKAEVQLSDGDHNIFMGMKVSEFSRGEKKGEKKFETYLYEKTADDKVITNPVIDGEKATAKEYSKLLSTALTFKIDDLFAENQTVHRGILEDLFSEELHDLGVDELVKTILEKKRIRDEARHDRDRAGATKEGWLEKGLTIDKIEAMTLTDTDVIRKKITALEVKKAVAAETLETKKETALAKIKEDGRKIVDEIRTINETRTKACDVWKEQREAHTEDLVPLREFEDYLSACIMPDDLKENVESEVGAWGLRIEKKHAAFLKSKTPDHVIIPIKNGVPAFNNIEVPKEYAALVKKRATLFAKYKAESDKTGEEVDNSKIDKQIKELENSITLADYDNSFIHELELWNHWIESDGIYSKEVDTLRALYAKINTGVDGLVINPSMTEGGKLEIYLEYNGVHDTELFKNKGKKLRRLYDYSKSQRAIVGILLQAARMDKKPKALRLVVLDDYTQTEAGKKLLEDICLKKDLKLVIAKTDDRTKVSDLKDGQFLIENGELLF